jgi:hypothetical protein
MTYSTSTQLRAWHTNQSVLAEKKIDSFSSSINSSFLHFLNLFTPSSCLPVTSYSTSVATSPNIGETYRKQESGEAALAREKFEQHRAGNHAGGRC